MKKYLALMMSLMMAVTVFLGNGMTANAETLKYELFLEDDDSNNPKYKVVYALSTDLSNRIDMKGSTFNSGDVITYQQESALLKFLYTVNLYIDNNNNPESGWTTTGASGTVYSYTLRDNVTVTNIVLESSVSGNKEYVTGNIYLETITGNQGGSGNQGSSGNQGGSVAPGGSVNPGSTGTDSGSSTKKSEKTPEELYMKKLLASAEKVKPGNTMVVDASDWHSFRATALNELTAKKGVSYMFYYKYRGECFYLTVPAGTVFDESIEWYGPYKMNAMFGRTMIDESTLNAAIEK